MSQASTVDPAAGTQTAGAGTDPAAADPKVAAQKAADTSVEIKPPQRVEVELTGKAALDVPLRFLAEHGLSKSSPVVKQALDSGDFSAVAAVLTEKGVKDTVFQPFLSLAGESIGAAKEAAKAAQEAARAVIEEAAGGAERWNQIKEWAGTEATPAEMKQVNAALTSGGFVARAVAAALAAQYDKAHPTEDAEPATALPSSAPRGTGGPSGAPLNPREFSREVAALTARVGAARLEQLPEYAALVVRRQAYRG